MTTTKRERVAAVSGDILVEQMAELKRLFPEVVSEGKIDFDKLRAALGTAVATGPERFSFTWNGKSEAIQLLQTPSRATLVPCPEESVNFDTTGNIFIEGDNLEVLKLLFKPYFGRVKLIYIDPPYNTGQDFIYTDDYAEPLNSYLKLTGQIDADGNLMSSNPDTSGRYHSAWLSMMYPRLFLDRQLLREDGLIFVSIDDHEAHHLRMLMNDVFGEENFLGAFVWKRRSGAMDSVNNVSTDHEYVLCFGREPVTLRGEARTFERYSNPDDDPRGPWIADNLSAAKPGGNTWYAIRDPATGYEYWPPKGRYWPYSPETMERKIAEGRILFPGNPKGSPLLKRFKSEAKSLHRPVSTWVSPVSQRPAPGEGAVTSLTSSLNAEGTKEIKELFGDKVFTYAKPVSLIKALVQQGTFGDGNLVVDFFSGSCTTAQAVLEANREDGGSRRFIMVQLPEHVGEGPLSTIAEIGKERIRRVIAGLSVDAGAISPQEDLGFKVFKLHSPYILPWSTTEAD